MDKGPNKDWFIGDSSASWNQPQQPERKDPFALPDGAFEQRLSGQDAWSGFAAPPQAAAPKKKKTGLLLFIAAALAALGVALLLFHGKNRQDDALNQALYQILSDSPTAWAQPTPTMLPTPVCNTPGPSTAPPTAPPTVPPTAPPTAPPTVPSTAPPTVPPTATPSPAPASGLSSSWYDASLRYYYQQLTQREKRLMEELYRGIMAFEQRIAVTEGVYTLDECKNALEAIFWDSPELFQVETGYGYTLRGDDETLLYLEPVYRLTQAEYNRRCARIRQILEDIRWDAAFGNTAFSQECAVYRYLLDHCQYLIDGSRTIAADGPLCEGYAQCSGYAAAFSLMLRCCGIPAAQLNGLAGGEDHSWNLVMLDGEWYLCDPTFDDPKTGGYRAQGSQMDFFAHLNLPEALLKNHIPQPPAWLSLPRCVSIENNFAYREGVFIPRSAGNAAQAARDQVSALYRAGVTGVLLVLEEDAAYADYDAVINEIVNELRVSCSYYSPSDNETHALYLVFYP